MSDWQFYHDRKKPKRIYDLKNITTIKLALILGRNKDIVSWIKQSLIR